MVEIGFSLLGTDHFKCYGGGRRGGGGLGIFEPHELFSLTFPLYEFLKG